MFHDVILDSSFEREKGKNKKKSSLRDDIDDLRQKERTDMNVGRKSRGLAARGDISNATTNRQHATATITSLERREGKGWGGGGGGEDSLLYFDGGSTSFRGVRERVYRRHAHEPCLSLVRRRQRRRLVVNNVKREEALPR